MYFPHLWLLNLEEGPAKAFWIGPTITDPEFKDLGSRLISKEEFLAASHCRLCFSNTQCCIPQLPRAGEGGLQRGARWLPLRSQECTAVNLRNPYRTQSAWALGGMDISTYIWKDGASQSCRFRMERGHSRVPVKQWPVELWGQGHAGPQTQRGASTGVQSVRAAAWVSPSKAVGWGSPETWGVSSRWYLCPNGP